MRFASFRFEAKIKKERKRDTLLPNAGAVFLLLSQHLYGTHHVGFDFVRNFRRFYIKMKLLQRQ
jgi:hypothetical protein